MTQKSKLLRLKRELQLLKNNNGLMDTHSVLALQRHIKKTNNKLKPKSKES